jgi:MFS family permease
MGFAGRLGALQERQFRLLWGAQAVSAFGDGLFPVALAFAVVELTGAPGDLGIVFAAVLAPRVVLVLAGGVWADRLPRQRVMLAADLLRCGTQAAAAVVLLAGEAELWLLIVLAAVYGAGEAFFAPAVTGLVPQTVAPARLQEANALLGLTRSASFLVGPAVAGVLVATAGAGWAFAGDAASFAVSACFLARIRVPRDASAPRSRFLVELRAGWREVRTRRWVWTSIAFFSLWNLAIGPLFVLGPFVAARSLGGASSWGVIVTCAGVGSLVGAAVALRWRPRRPLATGFMLFGLGALEPALLARPFPTALVATAAALGFGAAASANAMWLTTLQERIPPAAISRVSAYDWLGSIVFQPAGYVLVGPLVAALGTRSTLLLCASALAAASIGVSSLGAVRAVRRVEEDPPNGTGFPLPQTGSSPEAADAGPSYRR